MRKIANVERSTIRIKKGDTVKVIAGSHKGKTAKVLSTSSKDMTVTLEGLGVIKRHVKPSQLNPRGGTKEIHKGLPLSNVALISDATKGVTSRIGYKLKGDTKVRLTKKNGKEL